MPFRCSRVRANSVKTSAALTRILRTSLLWCSALASIHLSAHAQTAVNGAISGFVLDTSGAALAGATIEVHNNADGSVRRTTTQTKGEFLVPNLPAGDYTVAVDYALFARLILPPVVVEVGATTSVEARLHLATVSTTVNVSAEPAVAISAGETSSATTSVITFNEINLLPTNAQRWQSFALLTPTANPDSQSGDSEALLSFRGLASTQNSTSIDGANDDQSFASVPRGAGIESGADLEDAAETGSSTHLAIGSAAGGGGYGRHSGMAYTFTKEAVREFRVSSQNYSALYGHAAGGIITTVSKSGTNDLHGTAFYLVRSSAFGATNPFSIATSYNNGVVTTGTVKPNDLRQQFGGSAGGPILRDKLFFFYAYDQQARTFPADLHSPRPELLRPDLNSNRSARQSRSHPGKDQRRPQLPQQPHRHNPPQPEPNHQLRQIRLAGSAAPSHQPPIQPRPLQRSLRLPLRLCSRRRPRQSRQQLRHSRLPPRPLDMARQTISHQRTPRSIRPRPPVRTSPTTPPARTRNRPRRHSPRNRHRPRRIHLRHLFLARPQRLPRRRQTRTSRPHHLDPRPSSNPNRHRRQLRPRQHQRPRQHPGCLPLRQQYHRRPRRRPRRLDHRLHLQRQRLPQRRLPLHRLAHPRLLLPLLHPKLRPAVRHLHHAGVGRLPPGRLAHQANPNHQRRPALRVRTPPTSPATQRRTRRSLRHNRRNQRLPRRPQQLRPAHRRIVAALRR